MTTQAEAPSKQEYNVSPSIAQFLPFILSFAFVFSGAFLGYLLYGAVKNTVATIEVPALPYIGIADIALPSVSGAGPITGARIERGGEIPVTGITGVPLPDYEKQERVNILLLGVDKRPDETYSRTDTMILVTVDPENKTAGMLSIPRDLFINIPGYNQDRINKAHYFGEKYSHPGGGPALAMQTVQQNLDVPVHFYIRVDFDGFRRIVDTLGGIEVDVPQAIDDPTFPDQNYGFDPFYIDAGRQTLDGEMALKYARTRHAPGSDFGRAERQQQVLLAIRDKALQLGIIPKIPDLWSTASGTVETNLQLVDILALADLADDVTAENVDMVVLGEDYTTDYVTDYGAMVLLPIFEKITPVVDAMFAEVEVSGPTQAEIEAARAQQALIEQQRQAQEAQRAEIKSQLETEGARVVIQNGTNIADLEAETAAFLAEQGFNIVHSGPADLQDYPSTVIVDYSAKEYSLGTLALFFGVSEDNIRRINHIESNVDIRVIIGADFEMPEIMTEPTELPLIND